MRQLTFLGTASGLPKEACCASLLLEEEDNHLLIDLAGGHELLRQFLKLGRALGKIRNVFISHADTDHILGIYPLIRAFKTLEHDAIINIFCSEHTKRAVISMFQVTANNHYRKVEDRINFVVIEDGTTHRLGNWQLVFFDLRSDRTPQMGFKATFPDGKTLAFLGDEPVKPSYERRLENVDYLIHNAFCLEKDKEQYQPHRKNHSTVRDAAEMAQRLNAKELLLFHMEDETLETRKEEYAAEAKEHFTGPVFVPLDLEVFRF